MGALFVHGNMDAFDVSLVTVVAFLSFCGKGEAYLMNKEDDEKLLILAIAFVVILAVMLLILVIVMCYYCSKRRREKAWNNNSGKDLYNVSFKEKQTSPFYGGANTQSSVKQNVYLPEYETVGPMYENPGPKSEQYRVEKAEEPQEYESLDMGALKKPTSFSNEAYETMNGSTTSIVQETKPIEQVSNGSLAVSAEKPATNGSVRIVSATITDHYETLTPSAPLEEEEEEEEGDHDDTAF